MVRQVVAPFAPKNFCSIAPSPEIYFYRNKVEFAFGSGPDNSLVLGLRQKGQFDAVVNLKECLLLSPDTPQLLDCMRTWALSQHLAPYNLRQHRGFLRYLVVREGKNTNQRMIHLVTAPGNFDKESLLKTLAVSGCRVDTVVWSVHAGVSDVAHGQTPQVLLGSGKIQEKLGNLTFEISPNSFFQTNTKGAEVLYGLARQMIPQADTLLDFYCGSGTIGLFCADLVKKVLGVEMNAQAVADAQANVLGLKINNAEFVCSDAASFVKDKDLLSLWQQPGTLVVMDPPRPGLQPGVRLLLRQHPLDYWIYVSCNPKALAVDLPLLREVYDLEIVQPVDLFPHTPHIETIVLFKKR